MSKYPGRIVSNLAPAGYSVALDGTGDYLNASPTALGSGNFTIECWVYLTGSVASKGVFHVATSSVLPGTVSGVAVASGSSGGWTFYYNNGTQNTNTSLTAALNTWIHIAVVKSGTTISLYINGILNQSQTDTANYTNQVAAIGGFFSTAYLMTGNISNFRMVNSALYSGTSTTTANFNLPTQLLNITGTSLLTCNSPAIIDQSTNNFTITANGNAAVSTLTPFTAYVPYNPALGASTPGVWTVDEAMQAAGTRQWNMYDPSFNLTTLLLHGNPTNGTSFITDASTNNFTITPFGDVRAANLSPFSLTTFATSGSGYFDGSGDYLQTPSNAALGLSTGDFTVECWYYQTSRALTNTIIAPSTDNLNIYINTSGILGFYDGVARNSTTTVPLNTWSHIALVRSGSTATLYYNGTAVVSQANTTNYATASWFIGRNPGGTDQCTGYCSNVRIVKGVAVYTGAFTTPTAPLTATQAAGTNISAITGTQTSLLTLQNSQSANNNAFLDSSSNNFLITRNGNTTQGSFSPFSQGGWSNYFDGTGDYLTVPNNAAFNLSTNDFTLELFWYPTTFQAGSLIECSSTSNYAFAIYAQASGAVQFYAGTGASASWNILSAIAMGTATLNAWNHIVVVRSGTTFSYYLNGTRTGQSTSVSAAIGQQAIGIGGNSVGASITGPGYISNIRLVNGTAVYSGTTLTVPTAPLTTTSQGATASQVELLTCQSNRFIDNSDNAFTITRNGDTSVQAFSPFYPTAAYTPQTIGGSGYFDGTGDFLSSPSNAALALGSSDFSIEWWENRNVVNPDDTPVSTGPYASFSSCLLGYSGTVGAVGTSGGSGFNVFNFPAYIDTLNPRSWTHFVYTRSGTAFRVFMNGKLSNYATGSGNILQSNNQLCVGGNPGGDQYSVPGYITNFRVVIGSIPTGYQTSSTTPGTVVFTPPTAPPTTTSQGATANDVKLLLNFTNAGVVDSTAKNALETVGDARISTAVSRFGGSSMFFDGTGDFISIRRTNLLLPVANQDFTFECWVYPTATPGAQGATIMGCGEYGTDDNWNVNINSSLQVSLYIWSANNSYTNTTRTVTVNAWNHIAVARSGTGTNNLKVFVNGIGQSFSVNNTLVGPTRNFSIGADENGDESVYTGYIDELRFTLGVGRYTADFTPQTSQWQDQ